MKGPLNKYSGGFYYPGIIYSKCIKVSKEKKKSSTCTVSFEKKFNPLVFYLFIIFYFVALQTTILSKFPRKVTRQNIKHKGDYMTGDSRSSFSCLQTSYLGYRALVVSIISSKQFRFASLHWEDTVSVSFS